jgi:hypothetical protein
MGEVPAPTRSPLKTISEIVLREPDRGNKGNASLQLYNFRNNSMYPLEFLYWLYGAIKLGNLKSIDINSETQSIVLEHIKLVKSYERNVISMAAEKLCKPLTKEEIEAINFVKGIDVTINTENVNREYLLDLVLKIQALVKTMFYEKQNLFCYYLQGAFELTELDQIVLTPEVIKACVDGRFKTEILFYFKLTNDEVLAGTPLENFKLQVDRSLWTAC